MRREHFETDDLTFQISFDTTARLRLPRRRRTSSRDGPSRSRDHEPREVDGSPAGPPALAGPTWSVNAH